MSSNKHPLSHLNHVDFLYKPKLEYINKFINNIPNIRILELGVMHGRSTAMFLDLCDRNDGSLISIDIDDYSNLFSNKNWKFIKSRDDNFNFLSKQFKKNSFDAIYIDSLHEPNHVKKVLFFYYNYLKVNGRVFIDDINWLPFVKGSFKDSEYSEVINRKTFNKIIEIYYRNLENFELELNFSGTGTVNIKKLNENSLNQPTKIKNRFYSMRNFLRFLIKRKPKR